MIQRSRYRILGQVGQGQFGQVFCAIDRENGQIFALKDLSQKQFPTHKFLRELSYLVSLRHPNIVAFHGLEHHQTGRYLVMDYCEGGTLRELMESTHKLSLELSLKLVQDILSALVDAHRKKIIHCDIKPENILLKITPTGYAAKLSDFGIARWMEEQLQSVQGGGYTGSPAYMAPERFYGKYSAASDLYAVGILLYELLVGNRPFSGVPKDLMTAHLSKSFELSDTIPQPLQAIVEKALRKLPQRRFNSSLEMLEAVRSADCELIGKPWGNTFFTTSSPVVSYDFFKVVEQIPLENQVTALAVSSNCIYLGMSDQLVCQYYRAKTFLENSNHEYRLFLKEEVVQFAIRPTGCFIFTCSPSSNEYFLYHFANRLSLEQQQLKQQFSWTANRLLSILDEQGKWLAIASDMNQLQVYSLPNFKPTKTSITQRLPNQIVALDQTHGLVIEQLEDGDTLLQIFNRRGNLFNAFSLPLPLKLVTLSQVNSYELFAVDANHPYLGLLIQLKPLKITRIPLTIQPSSILAQPWGYIIADSLGKIIALNAQGIVQGEINLSARITAMSILNDSHILVATWSNGQSFLYQTKISDFKMI